MGGRGGPGKHWVKTMQDVSKTFRYSLGAAFGSSLGVALGAALGAGVALVVLAGVAGALAGAGILWLVAPSRGPSP